LRRLVDPTVALALSVVVINLAAVVAYTIQGEALGPGFLAVVGLCDLAVGIVALLRALGNGIRRAHPGRALGDATVALGLVTPLLVIWPDPIFAVARLVAPDGGQAIGEGFIAIFAALSVIVAGAAVVSLLRVDRRRSA
jgi:hypothetical protein